MKASYHAYCLEYPTTSGAKRCLFDIKDILETLVMYEPPEFKSSFLHADEHLYLLKESPEQAPHTYFFLITRDNELVKTIDSQDISMTDIREKISDDESIGFGSFVHVYRDSCLAFVGQAFSPKINLFWYYVNDYLEKIAGAGAFNVKGNPIVASVGIEDVMRMDRIAKTSIEIGKKHTFFQALSRLLNNGTGEEEIESIQITVNPKRNGNAKDFLKNLPQSVDDDVRRLIIKVQDEVFSSVTDLYIIGTGGLCESIHPNPRVSINVGRLIDEKMQDNQALSEKMTEYREQTAFEKGLPQELSNILENRRANAGQNKPPS